MNLFKIFGRGSTSETPVVPAAPGVPEQSPRPQAPSRTTKELEAVRRIQKAAKNKATTLDLQGLGLESLPEELFGLTRLTTLKLSNNRLTALPADVARLTELKNLSLNKNQFRKCPDIVGELRKLHYLTFQGNKLEALSPAIGQLTELRSLYVMDNQLKELPAQIGQLKKLYDLSLRENKLERLPPEIGGLESLEEFYLYDNKLTELPRDIGKLCKLRVLAVSANKLAVLPPDLEKLASLEALRADDNNLESVPAGIAKLTKLTELRLRKNKLSALPEELWRLSRLEMLHLSDNQIAAIPAGVGKLVALRDLRLANNKLTELPPEMGTLAKLTNLTLDTGRKMPPPEIAKQGANAVVTYLRGIAAAGDVEWVFEAKLVFAGDPEAGKSCLVRRLMGQPFDPHLKGTHGIEVGQLDLPHPGIRGQNIRFNAWDLAGDDMYHVTHQFFFSPGAIYLVLFKPRDTRIHVERWLKLIQNCAQSGDPEKPASQVILVSTRADQPGPIVNPIDIAALKHEYGKMIAGSVSIDSQTKKGFPELIALIGGIARELPDMGKKMPRRWVEARAEIERVRNLGNPSKGQPHISFDKFAELCAGKKLTREETEVLAQSMHRLGQITYYGVDSDAPDALQSRVVLDPEWITKAISYVFEWLKKHPETGGRLPHHELENIWLKHGRKDRREYELRHHPFLIETMERFDVSYPLRKGPPPEAVSLVAQFVPFDRPALPWEPNAPVDDADGKRELRCVVEFRDELRGLVPWLIVRNHLYQTGKYWQNGVLLKDADNHAVFELVTATRLQMAVRGPSPMYLYVGLQNSLERLIAEHWPHAAPRWLVPCPTVDKNGKGCIGAFNRHGLISSEGTRRTTACGECGKEYSIAKLLTAFEVTGDLDADNESDVRFKISELGPSILKIRSALEEHGKILSEIKQDTVEINAHTAEQEKLIGGLRRGLADLLSAKNAPCPRLFTLAPAGGKMLDPRTIYQKPAYLTLWCEHQHRPVKSATYNIMLTREWVAEVRPLARFGLGMLDAVSLGLGVSRFALSPADQEWARDLLKALEPAREIFMRIAEKDAGDRIDQGDAEDDNVPRLAEGPAVEALYQFLKDNEPKGRAPFGGMKRRYDKSQDQVLWVDPAIAESLDPV